MGGIHWSTILMKIQCIAVFEPGVRFPFIYSSSVILNWHFSNRLHYLPFSHTEVPTLIQFKSRIMYSQTVIKTYPDRVTRTLT